MPVRLHARGPAEVGCGEAVAALLDWRGEPPGEARLHVAQRDAILRAFGTGDAGLNRCKVQLERVAVDRLGRVIGAEQPLGFAVGLGEPGLIPTVRTFEIAQRFGIDREESDRGAVFGSHVRDGGAIRQRHAGQTRPEELDEFVDHALLAQHLRHGQHEIGGGDAIAQFAREFEAHDLRHQHVERLTEHDGFGLDAADTPADHTQTIDHGGVRVGADQRVRVSHRAARVLRGERGTRQVLEVHLMHDAGGRWHNAEVRERLLAPAQELVAFPVASELDLGVLLERGGGAKVVHLHGVIDDEIDRHQRIDLVGIRAHALHGFAHGGKIDHARHAGEVLENDARRLERNLGRLGSGGLPVGEAYHVVTRDLILIARAQRSFEQHADREWQLAEVHLQLRRERVEAVVLDRARGRDEWLANAESVANGCVHDASFPVTAAHRAAGKTGRHTGPPVNGFSL